jgi:hypothetical protein
VEVERDVGRASLVRQLPFIHKDDRDWSFRNRNDMFGLTMGDYMSRAWLGVPGR